MTMCRYGRNHIGTAGTLLPDTEVLIADGEILVRGPQVTPGYFEPGLASPLRDGWLATGDLGRVIGRQGRTAAALRTLLASVAEDERRVSLDIRDPQGGR